MKLQTKIGLGILPLILVSIFTLGIWSVRTAGQGIEQSTERYMDMVLNAFLREQLFHRYDLLKKNGLENVQSFVKEYQNQVAHAAVSYKEKVVAEYETAHFFALDNSGKVIFSTTEGDILDKLPSWWMPVLKKIILDPETHLKGHTITGFGTEHYTAYYFQPWEWVIFLAMPDDEMRSAIANIRNATIGVASICVLFGFMFVFFVFKGFFVQPVNKLKMAATSIARHEEVQPIDIHTRDELGELARAMETMAGELTKYHAQQKAWQNELEKKIQERTSKLRLEINERMQAEESLRETGQRLRNVYETAPLAFVIWDRDCRVSEWNKFAEKTFGWSQAEVIGLNFLKFLIPESAKVQVEEIVDSLLRGELPSQSINENLTKDGQIILCEWNNAVLKDKEGNIVGAISLGLDITERKHAEEALRKSEEWLCSIFNSAAVGIAMVDKSGRFTACNKTWCGMLGYSQKELLNITIPEITPAGEPMLLPGDVQETNKSHILEKQYLRKDGSKFWGSLWATGRYNRDGTMEGMTGIILDITDRKRAEEKLKKYHDHLEDLVKERTSDLEEANIRLTELDRMKSMFIASMSHELRTPLNSIIGFTSVTLDGMSGKLNKEQKDNLTRVLKSGHHLLDLIVDVIDISKIEAGKTEISLELFMLKGVIDEAADSVQEKLKKKRLSLETDVDPGLQIHTDRRKLLQCITNLLSNAVKFTAKGGISISAREKDNNIEISVTDTGIGIPAAELEKIFQPFERLESRLKVKAGGTGLGLYLTKKIAIDILGGNISVKSKEGKGSTFTLRLPGSIKQKK